MIYYFSIFLTAALGAISTFLFHNNYKQINPVFASASLTVVISIICIYLNDIKWIPSTELPYVFIGGSFIGMSTRKKAKSNFNILLASLFFSLIYLKSSKLFQGYGGALGISACISVLTIITARKLLIRYKHVLKKRKHI